MDLDYLIQILTNKVATLNTSKTLAFNGGDLEVVNKFDADIASTQNTLNQLQLARDVMNAANSVNLAPAELIANGVQASQNMNALPDNPIGCMALYDISTYATDPLHEQKIADILSVMGGMDSPATISAYISNEAIGSPVTGEMVFSAAAAYQVDIRLMMALMELDSRFGTVGVAIPTMNPGNVGNTGSATRTYESWQDGVNAVAYWLSWHRITSENVTVSDVIPEVVPKGVDKVITTDSEQPIPEVVVEPVANPTAAPEGTDSVVTAEAPATPIVEPNVDPIVIPENIGSAITTPIDNIILTSSSTEEIVSN